MASMAVTCPPVLIARPGDDMATSFGTSIPPRRAPGRQGRRSRRMRSVARAEPAVPELRQGLSLVLALQCAVMPPVQPPGADHRDPVPVAGCQGQVRAADGAPLKRG